MAGDVLDVVYLVRPGEDNEELRYSLRSLATNLPHGRVWMAGHRPEWVSRTVRHIEVPPDADKHRSSTANLLAACSDPGVPEHVLLFNDDFFITRPIPAVPAMHRGPVAEVLNYYTRYNNAYAQGMADTAALLAELGHPDPVSYELHVPMVIHTPTMRRLLERYGPRVKTLNKRTLYGNLAHAGGRQVADVKVAKDGDRWDPDGPFVSTNDGPFKRGAVGVWLRALFPDPCRYERPPKEEPMSEAGPVSYRNTVTGRVLELAAPDASLERSRRWERCPVFVDDEPDAVQAETQAAEQPDTEADEDVLVQPGGNASTEEWRAYAAAAGMDAAVAAEMGRNELREHFGA